MIIVRLRAGAACRRKVNAASLCISSVFTGKGKWRQPNRAVAQQQPVICPWAFDAKAGAVGFIAEELIAAQSSHVRRKPRVGNRAAREFVGVQAPETRAAAGETIGSAVECVASAESLIADERRHDR